MKKQGKVVRWDASRAFGFIRSPDTPADIFFHCRDFQGASAPMPGMAVNFEEIHVGGKGPRAMAVRLQQDSVVTDGTGRAPVTAPPPRHRQSAQHSPDAAWPLAPERALALAAAWAGLITWAVWNGRLPVIALPVVALLNLSTFFAYWLDKHAARTGRWRTAESTLHLLSLLGGWLGAWCAQQWLRHKSRKATFLSVYGLSVALHGGLLLGYVFRERLQHLLLKS